MIDVIKTNHLKVHDFRRSVGLVHDKLALWHAQSELAECVMAAQWPEHVARTHPEAHADDWQDEFAQAVISVHAYLPADFNFGKLSLLVDNDADLYTYIVLANQEVAAALAVRHERTAQQSAALALTKLYAVAPMDINTRIIKTLARYRQQLTGEVAA